MGREIRKVCGSVRVEGKNQKSVWWNNEVKPAVRRKEAAWKEVPVMKRQKKDVWKHTEKKRGLKGVYISGQKESK